MCKCIEKRPKEYTSNFREHYLREEHRFLVVGLGWEDSGSGEMPAV